MSTKQDLSSITKEYPISDEERIRLNIRRNAADLYLDSAVKVSGIDQGLLCVLTGIESPEEAIHELIEGQLHRRARIEVADQLAQWYGENFEHPDNPEPERIEDITKEGPSE